VRIRDSTGKAKPPALTEGSRKLSDLTRRISRQCFLCQSQAISVVRLSVLLLDELRGCEVTLCLVCFERLRQWIGANRVSRTDGRREVRRV